MPATIKAISSNSRQNAPCPSVRVLLNGRREARDSIARPGCSTEGATHAQNTDDVFYACRQHWGTDAACQRAISKSCHARAGGRASGISAIAKYRVATNLHVSEVWRDSRKREISVWTVPLASARSRPVIAFQGVGHFIPKTPQVVPRSYICAVPPSTNSSTPVTKLESPEVRKSATAAI
jgi:hypothetical protein